MSKIVLFVCLVIGTVYANTQVCIINTQYDASGSVIPGLFVNLNYWNLTTTIQPSSSSPKTAGSADGANNNIIPNSAYQTLPIYDFVLGKPLTLYTVDTQSTLTTPYSPLASFENFTFVENQSYTFVYIAESNAESSFSASVSFPQAVMLPFEERPNPSPTGKALVRIVNVALSTYNGDSMVVNVIGTGGVVNRTVSVPFGQASDFLEYDVAADLTLEFSLPLADSGISNRTLSVSTVVDHTQVVYIRGDIGDANQLGSLTRSIDFTFPAAPVAAPVVPPTAEPVSAPVTDTPTAAPVAATTPTAPTARTPTKRVSSAAQNVAQIAGVAALASLLF